MIEYNKRKVSSEFQNFLISGWPTAEGQKSQKRCNLTIFDPLRLETPDIRILAQHFTRQNEKFGGLAH